MKIVYTLGAIVVVAAIGAFISREFPRHESIGSSNVRSAEKPIGKAADSQPLTSTQVEVPQRGIEAPGGRVVDLPLEELLARNKDLPEQFKDKVRKNVAAIQRGEPVVEAGSVPGLDKRIEALRSHFKSLGDVVKTGLTRPPSDVSDTSLQQDSLIGAHVSGAHLSNGWTGLGRVFKDPVLGPVILAEGDLNANNQAFALMPSEAINTQIRDNPGVLSVLSDPTSGLSMTKLVWVDRSAGVSYEMFSQGTDAVSRDALLRIAEAIKP